MKSILYPPEVDILVQDSLFVSSVSISMLNYNVEKVMQIQNFILKKTDFDISLTSYKLLVPDIPDAIPDAKYHTSAQLCL